MLLLNAMADAAQNIGENGVVLRLRRSVYAFGAALLLVGLAQLFEVRPIWYLASVLPFYGAFSLAYQGLFKT